MMETIILIIFRLQSNFHLKKLEDKFGEYWDRIETALIYFLIFESFILFLILF